MSRKAWLTIIPAAGLLHLPRSAMSQIGGRGAIQGVVSDPSGAVTATAGGFQTLLQQNRVVDALSTVGLNLTLKIGAASERVTVSGTPPVLNTSDAHVGETLRNEVYTVLPLQMGGSAPRDPTAFAALLPGVPLKLAFQMDAFNAFNRVQFGLPSVTINSMSFGKVTSQSNGPRVVQLKARVIWE